MVVFDAAKDAANVAKHGISLAAFESMTGRRFAVDVRHSSAETRFHVVGLVGGRVHVAVVTYRADVVRVISLRRASRKERSKYGAT